MKNGKLLIGCALALVMLACGQSRPAQIERLPTLTPTGLPVGETPAPPAEALSTEPLPTETPIPPPTETSTPEPAATVTEWSGEAIPPAETPLPPPTVAPEAPPATPVPPPAPDLLLNRVSVTSPAPRNSMATVIIETAAGASCSIEVRYSSGASEALGLEPTTAGGDGRCSWTWKVGQKTTPGEWPIHIQVSLGDQRNSLETSFIVQ